MVVSDASRRSDTHRHRDRRRGVARGRGLRVRRKLERCPLSRPTEVPTEGRSRGEERRPGRCQSGGGSPSAASPRDHGGYCSVARLVVRLGVGALVESDSERGGEGGGRELRQRAGRKGASGRALLRASHTSGAGTRVSLAIGVSKTTTRDVRGGLSGDEIYARIRIG